MANLSLFGKTFTQRSSEEQLTLVKNARHLRRQRLPEKVRKAKVVKKKTTTKKQRVAQHAAFNQLTDDKQLELIEALIAKKKEELNGN